MCRGLCLQRICRFLEVAVDGERGDGGADTGDVVNIRGILVVTGAITCLFTNPSEFEPRACHGDGESMGGEREMVVERGQEAPPQHRAAATRLTVMVT